MSIKKYLEEIEEKIMYVTDTEDGKVDVWIELSDYEYLKQQAERVQELEQVIGDLDENVAAFETLWLEEKRKNQRYKQALEFYANKENYSPDFSHNVDNDKGEIARQALGAED